MQKLPGITSKNIDIVMRKVKNLDELIKLNKVGSNLIILFLCNFYEFQDQLKEILGNSADTENLYAILHEVHAPKEQAESSKQKGRPRNKFKYVKKS